MLQFPKETKKFWSEEIFCPSPDVSLHFENIWLWSMWDIYKIHCLLRSQTIKLLNWNGRNRLNHWLRGAESSGWRETAARCFLKIDYFKSGTDWSSMTNDNQSLQQSTTHPYFLLVAECQVGLPSPSPPLWSGLSANHHQNNISTLRFVHADPSLQWFSSSLCGLKLYREARQILSLTSCRRPLTGRPSVLASFWR